MTTKPTKATTAKVIPIKAARTAATKAAKATTVKPTKATTIKAPADATATKTGTPRVKKTTPITLVVVRFPNAVLGYLEIALQGPLGPDAVAHRPKYYPVTTIDPHGRRIPDYLSGAACQPITTRPIPGNGTDSPGEEPVPVTVCRESSAAFAQAHGATRCTHEACWPVQPHETEAGQQ